MSERKEQCGIPDKEHGDLEQGVFTYHPVQSHLTRRTEAANRVNVLHDISKHNVLLNKVNVKLGKHRNNINHTARYFTAGRRSRSPLFVPRERGSPEIGRGVV